MLFLFHDINSKEKIHTALHRRQTTLFGTTFFSTVEPPYPYALAQLGLSPLADHLFGSELQKSSSGVNFLFATFYFSKLRLCWPVITVGNRSTIDMCFIWPHCKKPKLSLYNKTKTFLEVNQNKNMNLTMIIIKTFPTVFFEASQLLTP